MDTKEVERLMKDIALAFRAKVPVVVQLSNTEEPESEEKVYAKVAFFIYPPEGVSIMVENGEKKIILLLEDLDRRDVYFIDYLNNVPYSLLKEKGLVE